MKGVSGYFFGNLHQYKVIYVIITRLKPGYNNPGVVVLKTLEDGGKVFTYSMPAVTNKKFLKFTALGLGMLILSALLVACGGTADTNYDLFVPSSLTAITTDNDFKNAVLLPNRTDIVDQKVDVYRTSQGLADLQASYNTEMTKRGWTNVSTSILKSDELGNNGVVLAFEKALPDASKKRVVGFILLGPDAKATWLTTFRDNGTLPKDQNVVIAIEGGTASVPTPAAPTATPAS